MPPALRRFGACSILFAALSLPAGPARAAKTQGWLNSSLTVGVGPHWSGKLTHELRAREADHDGTFLRNGSLGAFRALPAGFYAGLSFKREDEEVAGRERREDRWVPEAGWSTSVSRHLRFDIRARYEDRNFRGDLFEDSERGRLRFRLRAREAHGPLRLEPFVQTELFIGTLRRWDLDRNRFTVGTAFAVHPHVKLFGGYVRQDTRGRPALHAVDVGMDLSF